MDVKILLVKALLGSNLSLFMHVFDLPIAKGTW